jgi:hypothetical protein
VDRLRPLAAARRRSEAKEIAAGVADLAGPALSGLGLALAGVVKRIAWPDSETRQELQAAPQGPDEATMR